MADLQMEGKLDQLRGKIRSTWGDLTDDDFEQSRGDLEQLIGRIKERTGETADDIRDKLNDLMEEYEKEAHRM